MPTLPKIIFVLALALSFSGLLPPPIALTVGIVFWLIFPPIGNALGVSQSQLRLWAPLAIHDTTSVVGATTKYGTQALVIGTTVKLARALWIVPLTLGTAAIKHRLRKSSVGGDRALLVQFPWF